jgi:hypothetical protein
MLTMIWAPASEDTEMRTITSASKSLRAVSKNRMDESSIFLSQRTEINPVRAKSCTVSQCISGNARQTGSGFLKIILRRPSGS